jgi:hypothetical protein
MDRVPEWIQDTQPCGLPLKQGGESALPIHIGSVFTVSSKIRSNLDLS